MSGRELLGSDNTCHCLRSAVVCRNRGPRRYCRLVLRLVDIMDTQGSSYFRSTFSLPFCLRIKILGTVLSWLASISLKPELTHTHTAYRALTHTQRLIPRTAREPREWGFFQNIATTEIEFPFSIGHQKEVEILPYPAPVGLALTVGIAWFPIIPPHLSGRVRNTKRSAQWREW